MFNYDVNLMDFERESGEKYDSARIMRAVQE